MNGSKERTMITAKRLLAAATLGASLLLGACAYDEGAYGGVAVGYGSPDYYGSGYGGWYDNYYYPGSGYYVFDRAGARYRWNDRQRVYWQSHRGDRGGWHGGPRRAGGDYDGQRWNRDGNRDGRTVERGDDRGRGDGNWRGNRRGNAPAEGQTVDRSRGDRGNGGWNGNRQGAAPAEGQGFRGDRGGGRATQGQPARQSRRGDATPRVPTNSDGRRYDQQ